MNYLKKIKANYIPLMIKDGFSLTVESFDHHRKWVLENPHRGIRMFIYEKGIDINRSTVPHRLINNLAIKAQIEELNLPYTLHPRCK